MISGKVGKFAVTWTPDKVKNLYLNEKEQSVKLTLKI